MRVHIVCGYRSKSDAWDENWTDKHYRARNLVKAVKREAFRGFSNWSITGATPQRLRVDDTPEGQANALKIACLLLAKRLVDAEIDQADVVPVPSSQHVRIGEEFTGSRISDALQAVHGGMRSRPVLRFATPQQKSHDEGSRNPNLILPHLRSASVTALKRVVLLDDVMTSGGHLRAARRHLTARGVDVIGAIVIGRTVWERPDDMFNMPAEDLAD